MFNAIKELVGLNEERVSVRIDKDLVTLTNEIIDAVSKEKYNRAFIYVTNCSTIVTVHVYKYKKLDLVRRIYETANRFYGLNQSNFDIYF